ncbi:MAG: translesion error-prone DNA polymerase V autoproteolytic subunit [Spirochaetales bacterium]|nr:translesion error-prone DNA polymerase V autoproteolytic subunit [Spirochaetales bacterium]
MTQIDEAPVILCGFPSPAEDYKESNLDFNEYLSIHKPSVYALKARGDSMIGAGIFPDDIIIVDKAKEAVHNSLVIAEVDGAFTLKRLLLKGGVRLHSENPNYPDISFSNFQELIIFGVVSAIVRRL